MAEPTRGIGPTVIRDPSSEGRDEKAAYYGRLRTEAPWLPPSSYKWAWEGYGATGAMPDRDNYEDTTKRWWTNFPELQPSAAKYKAKWGIWPDAESFTAEYGGTYNHATGDYTYPSGAVVHKGMPGLAPSSSEPYPTPRFSDAQQEEERKNPWMAFNRAMMEQGITKTNPYTQAIKNAYGLVSGRLQAKSLENMLTGGALNTSDFVRQAVAGLRGDPFSGGAKPQEVDVQAILSRLLAEARKPSGQQRGDFSTWLEGITAGNQAGLAGLQDVLETQATKRYSEPIMRMLYPEGRLSDWQTKYQAASTGEDILSWLNQKGIF